MIGTYGYERKWDQSFGKCQVSSGGEGNLVDWTHRAESKLIGPRVTCVLAFIFFIIIFICDVRDDY